MSENLWPDFHVEPAARTPKSIIDEAGRGLDQKTRDVVRFQRSSMYIKDQVVTVEYSLYVPGLSYYFPFLQVSFPISPNYPATVVVNGLPDFHVKDENELTGALGKIFNAPVTVDTVRKLMSLAGK